MFCNYGGVCIRSFFAPFQSGKGEVCFVFHPSHFIWDGGGVSVTKGRIRFIVEPGGAYILLLLSPRNLKVASLVIQKKIIVPDYKTSSVCPGLETIL